jgi:predicted RND superfamily exporter protein
LVAVSIFGTTKLVFDSAIIEFFSGETEVSRSDAFLRTEFNGTKTFNINVKGAQKGDLNDPQTLAAMDDLATYLQSEFPEVGKVISYSQFIKRINQVLNADEPAEGLRGTVETGSADSTEIEELGFGFEDAFSEPELTDPVMLDDSTFQLTRTDLLELLNQAYTLSDRQDIHASELLSLINRTVNYEGAAYYEIPMDPQRYNQADREGLKNLIGNYLILIGSGTEEWSDDALEPSQARMSVQLNSTGNIATGEIADAIFAYVADNFPEGVTVELAGLAFIEKGLVDLVVSSQMWNIFASLIMVFLIISLFFRSLWAGFLAVVPLSVSILVNFGLMGMSGIKLDVATSMVAAITIGTGIDYTIHFLVAFHRGRKIHGDFHAMMERTILTTGKAIMFNAVSVSAGFAVLVFSAFNPLKNLGLLIAITMLTSSFVSLTLLPVLLDLLKPKFLDKPMLNELLGGKK